MLVHLLLLISLAGAAEREVIDVNNEFGGETIEIIGDDFTYIRQYFDADLTKVKESLVDALISHYHHRIVYPNFPGADAEEPQDEPVL